VSTRPSSKALVGIFVAALLYAGPAAAQHSSITDLGDLGGGASIATSINARGQVAGTSLRDSTTERGFIWQDGMMTEIGSLGGTHSVAYAINDRGQVVGGSNRAQDASIGAFVWHKGVMTDLGGANSFALGINDRGQVVGQVYAPDLLSSSAVLWEKGVMIELPRLGGNHAAAVGINSRGQIVGQSQTADGQYRAVMWDKGAITDLGSLGGSNGAAFSVNARGIACGFSTLATGEYRAAVYAQGAVVNLGTLGGSVSQCLLGANQHGQFVGTSTIAGDVEYHAFVTVEGVMADLNTQIPPDSGWLLEYAYDLDEHGRIVGGGHRKGVAQIRAFLLSHKRHKPDDESGDKASSHAVELPRRHRTEERAQAERSPGDAPGQ
jgi:probable HAF family extracellular repeat protein